MTEHEFTMTVRVLAKDDHDATCMMTEIAEVLLDCWYVVEVRAEPPRRVPAKEIEAI